MVIGRHVRTQSLIRMSERSGGGGNVGSNGCWMAFGSSSTEQSEGGKIEEGSRV